MARKANTSSRRSLSDAELARSIEFHAGLVAIAYTIAEHKSASRELNRLRATRRSKCGAPA